MTPAEGEAIEADAEAAAAPEAPVETRSEKPFFVYVVDPAASGSDVDKVEKVVLQDERVAYGARAFRAVRMTPEDAKADPVVGKAGSADLRFVIVSADFKSATPLEKSKLSASSTWDAMKAVAAKTYATSLETAVRQTREVVTELDRVASERKVLEEKKARLESKAGGDLKEVDAKLAALEEREAKAREREKAVWALAPKKA